MRILGINVVTGRLVVNGTDDAAIPLVPTDLYWGNMRVYRTPDNLILGPQKNIPHEFKYGERVISLDPYEARGKNEFENGRCAISLDPHEARGKNDPTKPKELRHFLIPEEYKGSEASYIKLLLGYLVDPDVGRSLENAMIVFHIEDGAVRFFYKR